MTPAEILRDARELLTPAENVARGTLARDAAGKGCDSQDRAAVCWCSLGAIEKASPAGSWWESGKAKELLRQSAGEKYIAIWNDRASHAEILAGFDGAIKLAEATQ